MLFRRYRFLKFCIGVISFALFLVARYPLQNRGVWADNVRATGRRVMALPLDDDCATSKGAVEEFPKDLFTQKQRLNGAVVVHLLVAFYMFALLAVVCDEYFVISLYHICARLDLDSNVAGATFMAIGSSAPTLFISVISIFFTETGGDVGLGTVVGSTIFNTLFIIATCGLAAKQIISLSCYPLLRDAIMYTAGTVALILTIRDGEVQWYEALLFVLIYAIYIVIMYFNRPLEKFFTSIKDRYFGSCCDNENDGLESEINSKDVNGSYSELASDKSHRDSSALELIRNKSVSDLAGLNVGRNIGTQTQPPQQDCTQTSTTTTTKKADLSQFEHRQESPFKIPDGVFAKIAWVLGMPVCLLFYITIPPCCKRRWSEWFLVTFLMSVLWMGTLSYILVWMVVIMGGTFNIPDCVMGMTFLAAGSSIPDVMASVIVARQGQGDMALSNAIGSNVFDFLCLGVPWLMKSTILNPGSPVTIYSQSIIVSAMLLIGSIVFTVLAIHLNSWTLDRKLGVIFLIVYVVFIALATLVEFIACPCQLEV